MVDDSLALVVCTYRRPSAVDRLLAELETQTVPPAEILIVDGSPDDETQAAAARRTGSHGGRLHYLRVPPEDRGLTKQRNYGVTQTNRPIVAFLDDDTVPSPVYFDELLKCFARHPDAAGVGGYIDEARWQQRAGASAAGLATYAFDGWIRRDDFRWRARRLLGLTSSLPPGWIPASGHGRPVSFLPPDGRDYQVEFVMGGASAWKRDVLIRHGFSPHFEGYGLYEDLEFCVRVARERPLFLCTAATLAHYHDAAARPNSFRYGEMVVRNGWYVWRTRWPRPASSDRLKWWATTVLLALCRLADAVRGPNRSAAFTEAFGRVWGMFSVQATGRES